MEENAYRIAEKSTPRCSPNCLAGKVELIEKLSLGKHVVYLDRDGTVG